MEHEVQGYGSKVEERGESSPWLAHSTANLSDQPGVTPKTGTGRTCIFVNAALKLK